MDVEEIDYEAIAEKNGIKVKIGEIKIESVEE